MSEAILHLKFEPYVNIKYKDFDLTLVAKLAKQGEVEAKEEFFARIQSVLLMMSNYYAKSSGLSSDDFLHEFYLCSTKAMNSYRNEQGDFERFLRCYLSNGARWYIARTARARKEEELIFKELSNGKGSSLNYESYFPDPDGNTVLKVAERIDDDKYIDYASEFIHTKLSANDKEMLMLYLEGEVSTRSIALNYNISSSGIYRHIKIIIGQINNYILRREKEEARNKRYKNSIENKNQ